MSGITALDGKKIFYLEKVMLVTPVYQFPQNVKGKISGKYNLKLGKKRTLTLESSNTCGDDATTVKVHFLHRWHVNIFFYLTSFPTK